MKKILIVLLLLTFSYTQNFGILKSKKNKSGLGIVFTLQHSYKGGKEGSNILDVPGQFNFKISYRMKSDIEVFGSITPGKFTYEEEDINSEQYLDGIFGLTYSLYQKKWGCSVSFFKNQWYYKTHNIDIDNLTKRTGFAMSMFSRRKYHPYLLYTNIFNDAEYSNTDLQREYITLGGMEKIGKYLLHWGWTIALLDEWEFNKDNASFFIGGGVEFF